MYLYVECDCDFCVVAPLRLRAVLFTLFCVFTLYAELQVVAGDWTGD